MRPADQIETILRSATTALDRERRRCAEASRAASDAWRTLPVDDDLDDDERDDDGRDDEDRDESERTRRQRPILRCTGADEDASTTG